MHSRAFGHCRAIHALFGRRVVDVHGPVVDVACDLWPPLHRALERAINGGAPLRGASLTDFGEKQNSRKLELYARYYY